LLTEKEKRELKEMITPKVFEDLIDKVLKDEKVEIKIDDSS